MNCLIVFFLNYNKIGRELWHNETIFTFFKLSKDFIHIPVKVKSIFYCWCQLIGQINIGKK